MGVKISLSPSNKALLQRVFRILTLSTIFVQIGFSLSSFAEVSGPMLPDAMDIVEETIKTEIPAQKTSIAPAHILAVTATNQSSQDVVCKGTSTNGQWYRRCGVVGPFLSMNEVEENIRCEGFYFSRYSFDALDGFVTRRNASVLALSMARNTNRPISITQEVNYKNIQNDLRSPMFPWTKPIVESDLDRNIVTLERTIFEPSRFVTRSEAFSMLMASVCMYPKTGTDINWQKNLYDVASQNGLTAESWSNFAPNKNISVRELALLTTRTADWAEKTGGCNMKPVQCVK